MKTLFKIALGLVIVGIIIGIAGIIAGGAGVFGTTNPDDYILIEESYDVGSIDKVVLQFANKRIYILPSESDQIEIKYYETEQDPVVITETSSTLSFIEDNDWDFFWSFDFSWLWNHSAQYTHCYLYLPVGSTFAIDAMTSNGDISIEDLTNLDYLDLHTSNGAFEFTNIAVDNDLVATTSNGGIDVLNVICGGLFDVATSNGAIDVTNLTADEIEADTSNGSITFSVVGAYADFRIILDTSNGSMYIDGNKVADGRYNTDRSREINLDTSNGTIRLNFID